MPLREPAATPSPRLLGALFLGTLLAALDIAMVGPSLPALAETFGLDERGTAWVFAAFVLANLAGLPISTGLSDRHGRRLIYLGGTALFALGTVVVVTAPGFEALLAGRVIQGFGASGLFPVAAAVVGDVYAPEQRGRAVGILGAVFGVAFLIGPILGGIMLAVANWRWLFSLLLPLAAVVFWTGARVVPDTRADEPRPPDLLGTALLIATLVLIALGLSRADATALSVSLLDPTVGGLVLLGLLAAVGFVFVERRAEAPLVRPSLVARRPVQIACAMAVGAGLVEATFVFLPAYAVEAFGVTRSQASYLLLPLVLAMAVASPVAGRLLDRIGPAPIVGGGAALLAIGLGGVATAQHLGAHVLGTIGIGLGLAGLLGSSLSYILLNEAGADERAVAQGLSTIALTVGQMAGAALVGAVAASAVGSVAGYRTAFGVVAAVMAVLVFLAFGLRRPKAVVAGR